MKLYVKFKDGTIIALLCDYVVVDSEESEITSYSGDEKIGYKFEYIEYAKLDGKTVFRKGKIK